MTTRAGTLRFADRYRVLRRLGSGGMATVYLAEDERLGRRVAVKRLHAESPEDVARRFDREARLGASLNHPNLVAVFDTVADPEGVLIVMEYVDGPTLGQTLKDGPLAPERALGMLRGVAAALDHAHEHGIIHRDVKPANILLGEGGGAKLADLGIAFIAERATHITRTGTVLGTPSYMAPEQLESRDITYAVDIYALGALAFETLSGRKARTGSSPVEIAQRIATLPAPELREAWSEAPAPAAEALCAAMDADPERRPRSAGDLVEWLRAALEGRTIPMELRRRVSDDAEGGPRPGLAAGAAGGAAAGAALAGAADEEGDEPGQEGPVEPETGETGGGSEAAVELPAASPVEAVDGAAAPAREPSPAPVGEGAREGGEEPKGLAEGEQPNAAPAAAPAPEAGASERALSDADIPAPAPDAGAVARREEPAVHAGTPEAAPDEPQGPSPEPNAAVAPPGRRRSRASWLAPAALILLLALGIAAVALLSGGGGATDSGGGSAEQDGSERESTSGSESGTASGGSAAAAGSDPMGTVRAFYERAAADDFEGAWALAGPGFRRQLGGYRSFRGGLGALQSIEFPRATTTSRSGDTAQVAVQTVARHIDRVDRCNGSLSLGRGSSGWLIERANIACSSGGGAGG